jgi:hypothetical protein
MKLFKFDNRNSARVNALLVPFSAYGTGRDSPLYITAAVTFSKLLLALSQRGMELPSYMPVGLSLSGAYLGQPSPDPFQVCTCCLS